jgi:hypothetical protein
MIEFTKRDLSSLDAEFATEVERFIESGRATEETKNYIESNPDAQLMLDRAFKRIKHNYNNFVKMIKSISTKSDS